MAKYERDDILEKLHWKLVQKYCLHGPDTLLPRDAMPMPAHQERWSEYIGASGGGPRWPPALLVQGGIGEISSRSHGWYEFEDIAPGAAGTPTYKRIHPVSIPPRFLYHIAEGWVIGPRPGAGLHWFRAAGSLTAVPTDGWRAATTGSPDDWVSIRYTTKPPPAPEGSDRMPPDISEMAYDEPTRARLLEQIRRDGDQWAWLRNMGPPNFVDGGTIALVARLRSFPSAPDLVGRLVIVDGQHARRTSGTAHFHGRVLSRDPRNLDDDGIMVTWLQWHQLMGLHAEEGIRTRALAESLGHRVAMWRHIRILIEVPRLAAGPAQASTSSSSRDRA
jgi:hypothetical protein